ncbi:MAG: patatin-like phospholipase family protein [Anaerolineales bacterium]|nr:patatin-like phospholipase family protein [Anaerolineales bacterium]MDW8161873.1 patatin-like phospholipase family protein [Anaerolineales bacterium]
MLNLPRKLSLKRPLAIALGGGGARGALQVGALRALVEHGVQPDILVGTSIGAVNATYLAIHGLTLESLKGLEQAWHKAAQANLLPANYLWLTLRFLLGGVGWRSDHRLREFFIMHGLSPKLTFAELCHVRLILVATDLDSGKMVLYGEDLSQSVLEGLLASTALPPWVYPLDQGTRSLIDGGVVSTLPIEPSLRQGAKEIIALDLMDPRVTFTVAVPSFGPFIVKLINTVEQRQLELEMALAAAHRVPVWHIQLRGEGPVPMWDFSHTAALIEHGYQITQAEIRKRLAKPSPEWLNRLRKLLVPNP